MGTVKPAFGVEDININNLKDLTIADISAGRDYGRRFQISNGNVTSDEVVFKDIFKRVKTLALEEKKNPKNLEKIKAFLVTLKEIDEKAEATYNERIKTDPWYEVRTIIHRLFNIGTHAGNIDNLTNDIDNKIARAEIKEWASIHEVAKTGNVVYKMIRLEEEVKAHLANSEPEKALKAFDILAHKLFVKDMDDEEKALFLQIVESFIKNAEAKSVDISKSNFDDLRMRSGHKDDIDNIKKALINYKIRTGDLETAFKMVNLSPDSEDSGLFLMDIIDRVIQKAIDGDDNILKSLIDKPNYLMALSFVQPRQFRVIADIYLKKAEAGDDTILKSLIDKPNYLMAWQHFQPRQFRAIADLYLKKAEAGDKTDSELVAEALQRLPDDDAKAALLERYNAIQT